MKYHIRPRTAYHAVMFLPKKNSSSFREIQQEEEKNLAYKDRAVIIKITGAFLKITTSEVASIPLVGFGD